MDNRDVFSDIPADAFERKEPLDEWYRYQVVMYMKVGLFCHWSYDQFLDTPIWVVDYINDEIDNRLAPYNKNNSDGPGNTPLNWLHVAILLGLSSLFGSEDQDD